MELEASKLTRNSCERAVCVRLGEGAAGSSVLEHPSGVPAGIGAYGAGGDWGTRCAVDRKEERDRACRNSCDGCITLGTVKEASKWITHAERGELRKG